jgi:hypothetical protein
MQAGEEQVNVDLLWVESVCDDDMLIEKNIKETKLFSPDYKGMNQEEGSQHAPVCYLFRASL